MDIAGANNPLQTSVTSANRSWNDVNRNYQPDCDLLNFAANGDTLALTNGDTVGMPGLKLMKQHVEGDGHQH